MESIMVKAGKLVNRQIPDYHLGFSEGGMGETPRENDGARC